MAKLKFGQKTIEEIKKHKVQTFAFLRAYSVVVEADEKKNAPWTDRTAHARQTLKAGTERSGDDITLFSSHGMSYGVYLELACKKKAKRGTKGPGPYAVVIPTMEKAEKKTMEAVKRIWGI